MVVVFPTGTMEALHCQDTVPTSVSIIGVKTSQHMELSHIFFILDHMLMSKNSNIIYIYTVCFGAVCIKYLPYLEQNALSKSLFSFI